MNFVALILILVLPGPLEERVPPQDAGTVLARAEALYYEARFEESVELLLSLDRTLGRDPGRIDEHVAVKLQLALAYIGLNALTEADQKFVELLELDPDYVLDADLYAPKVASLFDESRSAFVESTCLNMCRVAGRQLELGDAESVLSGVESAPSCGCMTAVALDAADFFFDRGAESYRVADYQQAFEELGYALAFNGEHESAAEYFRRTEEVLEGETEQILSDWEQQFRAGEYAQAAASFQRLNAVNFQGRAESELARVRSAYMESAAGLLESWRQACESRDLGLMEQVEEDVSLLLPDPSLGEDLRSEMTCAVQGCIRVPAEIAIRRITSRVSPEIPAETGLDAGAIVRARLRVDENGRASVLGFDGGNPTVNEPIRRAVEQWLFMPAVIAGEGHCVETELSFLVGP